MINHNQDRGHTNVPKPFTSPQVFIHSNYITPSIVRECLPHHIFHFLETDMTQAIN